MKSTTHITVLREEGVEALNIKPDSIVADATLGAHGHADLILSKLAKKGTFIGIDADPLAIENATLDLNGEAKIILSVGNFREINSILDAHAIEKVDAILADLGWRMEQFSGNGKGFSFQVDEPLVMTYGDSALYPFTARDIVNEWEEESIDNILEGYGEERFHGRIARNIVEARTTTPIETTHDLVEIVKRAVPAFYRNGKINPATRTFQALRIAVNDELRALEDFLKKSVERLEEGGRLAVITFHSLEDRIVKHTFRTFAHDGRGIVITKKPILPTREEIIKNPRSRSAKLRIFQKNELKSANNSL
jgi:16S rRNA (cytosine1402-N4)-methyltransferase